MYYWVQRPTSITSKGKSPRYIDRADSYYLCFQNIPKRKYSLPGMLFGKAFKMIINVRVSCVKHALSIWHTLQRKD